MKRTRISTLAAVALALAPRPRFDPGTMMAVSMASTAVGGGLSAASTIAGGNAAKRAGAQNEMLANVRANQLDENAAGEIATAQRQMLDTQTRARLANSTLVAKAAGSGVDAGTGSPVTASGQILKRGSYQAMVDLWNGENKATGLENEAQGLRYSGMMAREGGEEQANAAQLSAAGTIAGTAGSMLRTYGAFKYPNLTGRPGVGYG